MDRTNQFDLSVAVNHFIEKINVNELLSPQEVVELKDHFLSQTEDLESTGLSAEEAFAVSKMRFGEPTMVQEEYEKSKPFEKWKRYLMIGCLSNLMVECIYSLLHLITIGFALLFSKNHMLIELPLFKYFHIIKYFYAFLFLSGNILFFRWIFLLVKNGKISNYKKYIPLIPFLFVILYSCRMNSYRFAAIYMQKTSAVYVYNDLVTGFKYVLYFFIAGMVVLAFWGIKKQWLYKTAKG